MTITKDKRTKLYSMDSIFFTINNVDYMIIATGINEHNVCTCCVKNVGSGKTSDLEHQHLARLILEDQQKQEVPIEFVSKNKKYRQVGIGL